MQDLFKLMPLNKAKNLIQNSFNFDRKIEKVNILDVLNQQLAADIFANEDVPGFNRSTVDGFAVNAKDTFGAMESLPAYLKIVGQVEMGKKADFSLGKGETCIIPTGGMLPEGSDSVVMVEYTDKFVSDEVAIEKPVAPGENVINKGEDVKEGQLVLSKGHRIRPQDLGSLASLGYTEIDVYKQYKVGIISTGNEVVRPTVKLLSGQVRDINSYSLYGRVLNSFAIPIIYNIVLDDPNALSDTVNKALKENDIVLLSGGSSVGIRDYTMEVFEQLGDPGILLHGLPVKPGKPTIVAASSGKLLFGLPGHPVSAMVIYSILVEPLLLNGNYDNKNIAGVQAKLLRNISSLTGREDHIRVKLVKKNDELWAEPILGKSGLINTLVKADGEIIISEGREGLSKEEIVEVKIF